VRVVAVVVAVPEFEVVLAEFEVGAVLEVVWERAMRVEAKILAAVRAGMGSEVAIGKEFLGWVEKPVLKIHLLRLVDAQHLEASVDSQRARAAA